MQHPLVIGHQGGRSHGAVRWDADAQIAFAAFVKRYLEQNPAPSGAATAHDFLQWSEALERDGRARLAELGPARHLHAVG